MFSYLLRYLCKTDPITLLYICIRLFEWVSLLVCQWSCPQRWCWNESWQWAGHAAPSGHVWSCTVTAVPNVVFGTPRGLFKVDSSCHRFICNIRKRSLCSQHFLSILIPLLFLFSPSFWPCNAQRRQWWRPGLGWLESGGDVICCMLMNSLLLKLCLYLHGLVLSILLLLMCSDAHIWLFLSYWSNTSALFFPNSESVYLPARNWLGYFFCGLTGIVVMLKTESMSHNDCMNITDSGKPIF